LNSHSILSDRVLRIKPSTTLAIAAKAQALKKEGKDIISLSVGEPDFDTPDFIKTKAIEAIQKGMTKYTAVEGILELRQAICAKFLRDNQLNYEPNQIIVSTGGKQSIFNAIMALVGQGDEVIIPAPYWLSYPDIVLVAHGTPVTLYAGIEQNFKITADQLNKAITPKTKVFIINSPSNPCGMAYSAAELKALGAVLAKHPNIIVMTDDIYEKNWWKDEPFSNILMVCPELKERTLIVHGVSKTYAMTGWRIGFTAGPKAIIEAMTTIQSQSTSNPCSISQIAALAALQGDQSSLAVMAKAFKERHDYLVKALNSIPGFECLDSDGAFYAFPRVQEAIVRLNDPKVTNDVEFAAYLLEKAEVALVPGEPFGAPGYIRLSFATSLDNLQNAVDRIRKALNVGN
jgi:aspartate aminotransferase